jgi:hypothetical protein
MILFTATEAVHQGHAMIFYWIGFLENIKIKPDDYAVPFDMANSYKLNVTK